MKKPPDRSRLGLRSRGSLDACRRDATPAQALPTSYNLGGEETPRELKQGSIRPCLLSAGNLEGEEERTGPAVTGLPIPTGRRSFSLCPPPHILSTCMEHLD